MISRQLKLEPSNKTKANHKPNKLNFRTMNIKILVILIFLPNIFLLKAQNHNDAICISGGKMELDYRKKPWKGNNAFLKKYLEQIDYFKNKDKVRFLVPVKFWVYRDNSGKGGASFADIKWFMDDLNHFNKINKTGIQFYIREIQNIHKTKRQIFNYYTEAPLQTIFRHTKPTINVYLIDRFKRKSGSKRTIKGTYNIATKSVILQRKNSSTGLTHETGHYFGLLHPHRHYNKGKSNQEPVSRTRTASNKGTGTPLCEERGDMLSDTPAEPKLNFLVDNDCKLLAQH